MSDVLIVPQPAPFAVPFSGGTEGPPGAPGGNGNLIGLFTALATMTVPLGTDLIRTSGHSVEGKGGAEYIYDASVDAAYVTANPHTSQIDAGGRGFKLSTDQRLNWHMFGLMVDDDTATPTNDYAAWTAMLAWQEANIETGGAIFQYGVGAGPLIYCFGASYHGGNTTTIDYACQLLGFTQGVPGASPTQIRWDDNANGIIIGADKNQHTSGYRFEGFTLMGGWTDLESESYALQWHAKGIRRNLQCYKWGGDALKGDNTNATTGNSNGDVTDRIFVQNCRFAHNINGPDTNGGEYKGIVAVGNRQGGLKESNSLGSQYDFFELEANARSSWNSGADANHPASYCFSGGHFYACVNGQEAWCQTNGPTGTTASNQGWAYWQDQAAASPSTGVPQWATGMFWRAGGGIIHTGASSFSSFRGYIESDECSQFDQFAKVDWIVSAGRANLFLVTSGTLATYSIGNRLQRPNGFSAVNGKELLCLNHLRVGGNFIHEYNSQFLVDAVAGNGLDITLQFKNNSTSTKLQFLKSDGTEDGYLLCSSSLNLYLNHKNGVNLRAGGTDMVTVTSSGLRTIAGSLGYGTGVGGTVAQATSRTTGVTLNKVCGQITLFSAAGSTSWQTFTVTNSQVAATDVVRVNQLSGTDKYQIHVTGVRAGAFDITFATTGGTTVEQPVFNFAIIKGVNA